MRTGIARRRVVPEADLFVEYRRTRSRTVRNEIVERHLAVAERSAWRFAGHGEPLEDLHQVALIGLINAVERFDPSMGVAFESFARPTIAGEIKRHFRDRTWRVSVPRRLKELGTNVFAAIEQLEQRLERSPTPDEVAALVGVEREVVVQALLAKRGYRSGSIEACREQSGDAFEDRSAHSEPNDTLDARRDVIEAVRMLDQRDRQIVYWRFFEECTQAEIGARLGIGQVQVSRLLSAVFAYLRDHCDIEVCDSDFPLAAPAGRSAIGSSPHGLLLAADPA